MDTGLRNRKDYSALTIVLNSLATVLLSWNILFVLHVLLKLKATNEQLCKVSLINYNEAHDLQGFERVESVSGTIVQTDMLLLRPH